MSAQDKQQAGQPTVSAPSLPAEPQATPDNEALARYWERVRNPPPPCTLPAVTKRDAAIYQPSQLPIVLKAVTTVEQSLALSNKIDTIGQLARVRGVDTTIANIALFLDDMGRMLGVKNKLNDAQLEFVATEIVNTYPHFLMSDFYLIVRRALRGHYGELYESINPPKVLRWFAQYDDERTDAAVRLSEAAADRHRTHNDADNRQCGRLIEIAREIISEYDEFSRIPEK